ncbi:MAG: hypothetical protein AOA65_2101 [Candidatus Bathyarchaeota archaeon BA1]|nr:MAG: hypothetical protein AOA65_2101 [Candidatus Bathyarchaeota archaeon BA1]
MRAVKKSRQVACTLPVRTYEKIGRLIEDGMFLNYSDFARTAIENELARMGAMNLIEIKDYTLEEAKKLILEYLQNHGGEVLPSDIADHYGMELDICFKAVKALVEERKVEEAS